MGGAAVASAAFTILPGYVLGLNGATSPNEKLNLAGIGVAGQGGNDLNNLKKRRISSRFVMWIGRMLPRHSSNFPKRNNTRIFAKCSRSKRTSMALSLPPLPYARLRLHDGY